MHNQGKDKISFRILSNWEVVATNIILEPKAIANIGAALPDCECELYFQAIPGPAPNDATPGIDALDKYVPTQVYVNTYHVENYKVTKDFDVEGLVIWWRKDKKDEWKELLPRH